MSEFQTLVLSLLNGVLAGSINHSELQKFVDNAVIEENDFLNGLSKEMLQHIFSLQTDLELIAENQDTYAGTRSMFSKKQIIRKLMIYREKLAKGEGQRNHGVSLLDKPTQ